MSNPTDTTEPHVASEASWAPLGLALSDYHAGDTTAEIIVGSDLWEDEPTPVAAFYRPLDTAISELELTALDRCRGRVLDLGAGAGRHALELQSAGLEVVALDLLPEAVSIMKERGVLDPRCGDLSTVAGETFDTVLLLMHGIGVVGNVHGLGRLLETLPGMLAPAGRIIFDSADLESVLRDESPERLTELAGPGRYIGEVEFDLRYAGVQGPRYPWLFIDPDRLALLAGVAGFDTEIVASGQRGSYLAVLERSQRSIFTRP